MGRAKWSIERVDGRGVIHPVPPSANARAERQRGDALGLRKQVEAFRAQLLDLKKHPVSQIAARREGVLRLLDVALAPNTAERHARVAKLGVTTTIERATDGRRGNIKTFIAKGKPRIRVFMPDRDLPVTKSVVILETPDGASDAKKTGRWKIGGTCYWDGNDSGPDQCSPNSGRWKDGNDGCYFDSGDDGPDQCEPAIEGTGTGDTGGYSCSDPELGAGDCATQDQYDDFVSEVAAAEAEYESLDAEQSAIDSELASFCSQNPSHPDCATRESPPSGPFFAADEPPVPCWMVAAGSATALLALISRLAGSIAIMMGPAAALTTLGVLGSTVGLYGAALAAAVALAAYTLCKFGYITVPAEEAGAVFEPEFGYEPVN